MSKLFLEFQSIRYKWVRSIAAIFIFGVLFFVSSQVLSGGG